MFIFKSKKTPKEKATSKILGDLNLYEYSISQRENWITLASEVLFEGMNVRPFRSDFKHTELYKPLPTPKSKPKAEPPKPPKLEPKPEPSKQESQKETPPSIPHDVKFSLSIDTPKRMSSCSKEPSVRYSISSSKGFNPESILKPKKLSFDDYELLIKNIEEELCVRKFSKKAKEIPFSQRIVQIVRERFESNAVTLYTKAEIDRRLFSKIISDPDNHPSKRTVIYLALAAELTLKEAIDLLQSAGYNLSFAIKEDIVYINCFKAKLYSVPEVKMLVEKYASHT